MAAYWLENSRPLAAFFGKTKLRNIASADIAAYQNARTDAGRRGRKRLRVGRWLESRVRHHLARLGISHAKCRFANRRPDPDLR